MISFSIARRKGILWIRVHLSIAEENLKRLDAERAVMLEREGMMDLIVDFTDYVRGPIDSRLTRRRAAMPSPAPGRRRVYVAPDDHLFGMMRMYAIPHDDPKVEVVRSVGEAFDAFDVSEEDFEDVPVT